MLRPEPFSSCLLPGGLAGRKHEGGAVQLVLEARGHDAHHAFVKVGVEHAHRRRRFLACVQHLVGQLQGLLAHVAFDGFALAVDAVERAGEFMGAFGSSVQQAFDAQRHVDRRPAALMRGPTQSRSRRRWRLAACGWPRKQAGQPGGRAPARTRFRPWATRRRLLASSLTTSATVPKATSGSKAIHLGLAFGIEDTPVAHLGPQGQQHVEHHTHAGD
jgi:hypothetical protein